MSKSLDNSKSTGFTLIEVMVASVILIASIAAMSMIYRGAFISSEKADGHINITGVLPSVLATVRNEIRIQGNSAKIQLGNQSLACDVNYQWQANLLEFKSAQKRFDPDTGKYFTPHKKYKLWQVNLTLERKGISKQYQFNELSWNND